jgi:C_GCAxxG_C_C family probable redox protein
VKTAERFQQYIHIPYYEEEFLMKETINGYTKEEAMEKAFKIGFESEKNRLSCSQSSFHAITTVLGYRNPQLFKSIVALQGGGADSGLNSCGAFCGPLVVFGYFFGRDYKLWEQGEMDLKASMLGQKLLKKFQETYGSAICKDIQTQCLGFPTQFLEGDVFNEEAFNKFEAHEGHELVAPTVVGRAAAWAVEILWDELPKDQDIDLSSIPSFEEAEKRLKEKIANLKKE